MNENQLSQIIIDSSFEIHKELGAGLFESVYEEILCHELNRKGLMVERQKPIPVLWNGIKMEIGFRADIIINNKVIVEIKSVESIATVHKKQLLTYLKITGMRLGLLINFNESLLKDGLHRVVNNL